MKETVLTPAPVTVQGFALVAVSEDVIVIVWFGNNLLAPVNVAGSFTTT